MPPSTPGATDSLSLLLLQGPLSAEEAASRRRVTTEWLEAVGSTDRVACHNRSVVTVAERPLPERSLAPEEWLWITHSEALWRKAHEIAAGRPDLDPGDIYHALRTLELPPSERLRRGLNRVRARPHSR